MSLEAKARSDNAEKPRPGAEATTSLMDVPSSNAALTTSRCVTPTAPARDSGEGAVSAVTDAAESRTVAVTDDVTDEKEPVTMAEPGDKPMTTFPEVDATDVVLEAKFVLPVTSKDEASVSVTRVDALTRW